MLSKKDELNICMPQGVQYTRKVGPTQKLKRCVLESNLVKHVECFKLLELTIIYICQNLRFLLIHE